MDNYYKWKDIMKENLKQYITSFQEDPPCSCILGLIVFIPFTLYVLFGCLYFILIVIPIKAFSYIKRNRIHSINFHNDNQIIDIVVKK